ncbi:MAG: hypothetical protein AAGJ82_15745, partial [Bacteroidota bacterium]
MDTQQAYRSLQLQDYPHAPWWLDQVSGPASWQCVQTEDKAGRITGLLPFQIKRRWGMSMIVPPALSPRLGPILFPVAEFDIRAYQSFAFRTLTTLSEQLPRVAYARIQWPYELTYGLPWQLAGWQQTVRYSYVLDLQQTSETPAQHWRKDQRHRLQRAQKDLQIHPTTDWRPVWELLQATFVRQGKNFP